MDGVIIAVVGWWGGMVSRGCLDRRRQRYECSEAAQGERCMFRLHGLAGSLT